MAGPTRMSRRQSGGRCGVDIPTLSCERRPLCRSCLDWSARRYHLAGALGSAVLTRCIDLGWGKRAPSSRVMNFSATGERALRKTFIVAS